MQEKWRILSEEFLALYEILCGGGQRVVTKINEENFDQLISSDD